MEPETRYAKAGGIHIAYQEVGDGPLDLVYLGGIFSHLELQWQEPSYERFLSRLASFARLIVLDMRGTGLSDRAGELPILEEQMDDLSAVLDEVDSEGTAIFGASQSGPMAILYAATYPQRVDALVLFGAYASAIRRDGYPWGRSEEWVTEYVEQIDNQWGTGSFLPQLAPSRADDEGFRQWWGRFERFASAPGNALAYSLAHTQDDVRHVLASVSAPTLILQRVDDAYRDRGHGQYLAEHLPGAKYVELSGVDHLPYVGDQEAILDEVEEFLTGVRRGPEPDRVLATVLFTDIVGSTQHAVEVGDRRWRETLEQHNSLVTQELRKYRGEVVTTSGDGLLATFDGPARAIRSAQSIQGAVRSLGLEIRAGIHTGELERVGQDVRGIAVHIGARVAALARPGEVLVSRTVTDLVAGSGIGFEDRGTHELKGVPGEWQLYSVQGDGSA